ncbi:MAG: hypothetical protein J6U96_01025 [Elusimicrobiaceae bacterium]|nr:hypothetical protein [Elusimicrobiaceae bacterium]
MDFYQIISLVALVAFVILVIYAVRLLIQLKKTAESVEYLALTTAEKVDKTSSTFELLNNVSSVLDNGFYKAIAMGVDLARRWHKKKED